MTWVALSCAVLAALFMVLLAKSKRVERQTTAELNRVQEANGQLASHAANYQQKLRALSDSSGAGMVVLDAKGVVIYTNATADRILNVEPDSQIGHSLIQATLSIELQQFVTRAASGGKV